ncbi:MAG TPA: toll/interleukin-1 receptor domain-containing protein [Candidatus Acidoferrum sp.]|nr:toll/interleukin-1 receptor domain-containing protein [Candidatus Acidoferrum sp.]
MGYLPEFDDDVFISYAHNDDIPRRDLDEKEGWVAQLHANLEGIVRELLGQEPSLWRDCEISANDDFTRKITNRLAKTATLLSVITDNYLEREWCQRELAEFCRHAESKIGLRVGEKRRIFKVLKREIRSQNLPEQFDGMERYEFYGEDTEDPKKSVHEYRPSLGGLQKRLYYLRMNDLAEDIADTLRVMRAAAQGATVAAPQGGTVFLAETSADQDFSRNCIKKELQKRNIAVLPQGEIPFRGMQFEQHVSEYLQQSDLSIHIFGNRSGVVPEGSESPHTWLQHDLAMQRANDPDFLRVVWLPKDLEPADEKQRQYLQHLRNDPAVQKGAEILEVGLEDLKTEVLHSLDRLQRKKVEPPPQPTASDEPLKVYLICDSQDLQSPSLLALDNFLFDQGFEPKKSQLGDNPEDSRTLHEDYLQFSDAYLIYYGSASEAWVQAKLNDFRKLGGKRQTPVLAKAIYIAAPLNDAKRAFRSHEAKVIQGGPDFNPASLAEFVETVRKPKGR